MGGGIYAKKPLLPQQPPVKLSPEEQVLGTPSSGFWDPPSFSVCIRGPLRCSRSNKLEEFLCPSRESEIAGRPSPLKSELFIAGI